jgi:hypothetical protein
MPYTIGSSADIKGALRQGAFQTNIATLPASDLASLFKELNNSALALSAVFLQSKPLQGRRGRQLRTKTGSSKSPLKAHDLKNREFVSSQAAVAQRLRLETSKVPYVPRVCACFWNALNAVG